MLPIPLRLIILIGVLTCGCATLEPQFETPIVNLTTIKPLKSGGLSPKFEIGLRVINPNRSELKLHGVACSLEIEGYDLLTGVSNNLPAIDGYSEANVTLTATASLMKSIQLFADIVNNKQDIIAYKLNAKLDLGGLYPNVHVEEKGEFNLSSFAGQPTDKEESP
jgi:LEA14-like dessication related protein